MKDDANAGIILFNSVINQATRLEKHLRAGNLEDAPSGGLSEEMKARMLAKMAKQTAQKEIHKQKSSLREQRA